MLTNKGYERYLKVEYQPAQDWYENSYAKEWIERNIPTLNKLLAENYNQIRSAVYCIQFNDIPVYIGEAIKPSDRLLVHAHNLYGEPLKYFGIEKEEINSGKVRIQVKVLKENLSNHNLRKESELLCIKKYKPLLQKQNDTDKCIPRNGRRKVIEAILFNTCTEKIQYEI